MRTIKKVRFISLLLTLLLLVMMAVPTMSMAAQSTVNLGVPEVKVVTTTVTGGQLPKTSTPMNDLLLVGAALTLVGVIGWRSRKRFQ